MNKYKNIYSDSTPTAPYTVIEAASGAHISHHKSYVEARTAMRQLETATESPARATQSSLMGETLGCKMWNTLKQAVQPQTDNDVVAHVAQCTDKLIFDTSKSFSNFDRASIADLILRGLFVSVAKLAVFSDHLHGDDNPAATDEALTILIRAMLTTARLNWVD
jgi:hypothetical protein